MDDLFVEAVLMLERVQAASLAELNGEVGTLWEELDDVVERSQSRLDVPPSGLMLLHPEYEGA